MNNELQIFNNTEFGEVRIINIDGKPYAVGADVARALGYAKPQNAVSLHCPHALKQGIGVQTGTKSDGTPAIQNIDMLVIPEGDVYRLIARSQLPSAEKFERWVFDEVLPSIRKHGAYMTPDTLDRMINSPEFGIKLLTALKDEREKRVIIEAENKQLQEENEKMTPKAIFADAVSASDGTILIGELAKILKGNGIDIGQNRLFEWLRNNGYLIRRKGTDFNMPTQMAMDLELFRIKETAISHSDGHVTISKTPKVTGRGQQYFINLFLSDPEWRTVAA